VAATFKIRCRRSQRVGLAVPFVAFLSVLIFVLSVNGQWDEPVDVLTAATLVGVCGGLATAAWRRPAVVVDASEVAVMGLHRRRACRRDQVRAIRVVSFAVLVLGTDDQQLLVIDEQSMSSAGAGELAAALGVRCERGRWPKRSKLRPPLT
jgi:hypothetical protein